MPSMRASRRRAAWLAVAVAVLAPHKRVESRNLCRTNFQRIGNPCFKTNLRENSKDKCMEYLQLPLIKPDCSSWPESMQVPKIHHAISGGSTPPLSVKYIQVANPAYRLNWHNDTTAHDYIKNKCGAEVAEAFRCFVPTAYRADLFRFCALASEGGVYVDTDQYLMVPLKQTYSNCSHATVGHDWALPSPLAPGERADSEREYYPGYQMKILAGMPGSPLFQCMVAAIVANVRKRFGKGQNVLRISGPALLAHCMDECAMDGDCAMRVNHGHVKESDPQQHSPFSQGNSEALNGLSPAAEPRMSAVAITYRDTRHAAWPYSGMTGTDEKGYDMLLSYERPSAFDFYNVERIQGGRNPNYKPREFSDLTHYSQVVSKGEIYRSDCKLIKDWEWSDKAKEDRQVQRK